MRSAVVNKWLVSLAVFVVVATIVWLAFTGICQSVVQSNMEQAQEAADRYSASLEQAAKDMVADTSRMADVARQLRTNDGWFASAAQSVVAQNKNIIGVQYTPVGRAPLAVPAGFSFNTDSGLASVFAGMQERAAAGDGTAMVVSPVKRQSGQECVIAMTPVLVYNSRTQQFDYLGNVALAMKLPEAIEGETLKAIQDGGYNYSIFGNNPALDKDGILARSEGEVEGSAAVASAKVPGGHWLVMLSPADNWSSNGRNMGIIISLVAGAILGGITLWGMSARQNRAESRRVLLTDSLTGAGNRRALQETLDGLCHQLKAHFVVACMNIDNLKGITKEHGREAGDAVLKEMAQRIQSSLKADDRLFRVGDDSFVAIIDNESLEGVSRRLNDIKQKVALDFVVGATELKAALDIGCSAFPMDSRIPAELVKVADQRMNAKKGIMLLEGTDWLDDTTVPDAGVSALDGENEEKNEDTENNT